MIYDTSTPRYAHLKGLTPDEITLTMIITDGAIEAAKQKYKAEQAAKKRRKCNLKKAE